MANEYDIAVVGATAAGYAAAAWLAGHKRKVVVLAAPVQAVESPLADWAPKDFLAASGLPRNVAEKAGAAPFSSVVYHSADLTRRAEYKSRGQAGVLLQTADLLAALKAAAEKVGVAVKSVPVRPDIRLHEDRVELVSAGVRVWGRYLLIAHSRPNDAISDLALPVQNVPLSPMVVAALDVPWRGKAAGKALAGELHVVETVERTDLGMFFPTATGLHVRLVSASVAAGSRVNELSSLISKVQKAGLVPADLNMAKARGAVWHPPAGVALELEAHVAKRCLLIGTAGGFAEAITGQTIAPTIRSASLAAEVLLSADGAADPQEELIRYKTIWRKELADYLRPPNTSLQMLLPLLFVNQQIVPKFTRALLYGENI
jgi:flavin-dependent dehydrogenase